MKEAVFDSITNINKILKNECGITDEMDRIILTAGCLVLCRYDRNAITKIMASDPPLSDFMSDAAALFDSISDSDNASAIAALRTEFSLVRYREVDNVTGQLLSAVVSVSDYINSDEYNGEDLMAVLFMEFSRSGGKSDAGQIFTPSHIGRLICRVLNVGSSDKVLDATCGSGSLLTSAISCGVDTSNLYGIELYDKLSVLASANMLMRNGGISHILNESTLSDAACAFIRNSHITKAILNPPYERKYKCADIVCSVLDNVEPGTVCAFILPDKKFEKESKLKKALNRHTLTTIIKLPEDLFFNVGVTTSIFILKAGEPQNGASIAGYYIEDDGFETIKNKGRLDIKDKWSAIEDYWVNAIQSGDDAEYNTRQYINPSERLSYKLPEKPFEIREEDFTASLMNYECYKRGIDIKALRESIADAVLYRSQMINTPDGIVIFVPGGFYVHGENLCGTVIGDGE